MHFQEKRVSVCRNITDHPHNMLNVFEKDSAKKICIKC